MSGDHGPQPGHARPDVRNVGAWVLWLTAVGCLLSPLVITGGAAPADVMTEVRDAILLVLPLATFGLILALRRPRHPIGWLYSASALFFTVTVPLEPWIQARLHDGRPLPTSLVVFVLTTGMFWAPVIACAIPLPFLFLPDGRLRSRRWRSVLFAIVGALLVMVIVVNWLPGEDPESGLVNPHAPSGAVGSLITVVFWTAWTVFMVGIPAAVLSLIQRFRASHGVERQQLRWIAAGGAVTCAGFLPSAILASDVESGAVQL